MSASYELFRDTFLQLNAGVYNIVTSPITLGNAFVSLFKSSNSRRYKNIVVTGASSGIGKEFAMEARLHGVENILLFGRTASKIEYVANQCRILGMNVQFQSADFCVTEECQQCVDKIKDFDQSVEGGVDLVICFAGMSAQNAGESVPNSSDALSQEFYDALFHVNVISTFNVSLCLLDRFKQRHKGHIVIVSSINGLIGPANQIIYNSTKAALLSFARDLQVLVKSYGVLVSVVTPGFIRGTAMTEPQIQNENAKIPEWGMGNVADMSDHIWKGIRNGQFLITYPFSHFWNIYLSHSQAPTSWLWASKWMAKSGLFSKRLS